MRILTCFSNACQYIYTWGGWTQHCLKTFAIIEATYDILYVIEAQNGDALYTIILLYEPDTGPLISPRDFGINTLIVIDVI